MFLPRKSHEQRSLVGYSSWDCRDVTEWLNNNPGLSLSAALGLKGKVLQSRNAICLLGPRGVLSHLSGLSQNIRQLLCLAFQLCGGALVAKSCPTLVTPWAEACQAPLSVYGILQARITGVGCHFLLRGSSWPRNQTQVSCIACRFFSALVDLYFVLFYFTLCF